MSRSKVIPEVQSTLAKDSIEENQRLPSAEQGAARVSVY